MDFVAKKYVPSSLSRTHGFQSQRVVCSTLTTRGVRIGKFETLSEILLLWTIGGGATICFLLCSENDSSAITHGHGRYKGRCKH